MDELSDNMPGRGAVQPAPDPRGREGVAFEVSGLPVGKGRPRATTVQGKASMFTPAKTRQYEHLVQFHGQQAMDGRTPFTEALFVTVIAHLPIPKSKPKKWKAAAQEGRIQPTTRPDVDNYAKAALDAMNGIVFVDDSQVSTLLAQKVYSDRPRLEIKVFRLGGWE